jgi:hypothetical protein
LKAKKDIFKVKVWSKMLIGMLTLDCPANKGCLPFIAI